MKNTSFIRHTFVRQTGPLDCGKACLMTILNYIGQAAHHKKSLENITVPNSGLSLLDLKKASERFGLKARCVHMDLDTLRLLKHPIILHALNKDRANHFIVFFKAEKKGGNWQYLIGDPASSLLIIEEDELLFTWPAGAALFFEDMAFKYPLIKELIVNYFISVQSFPRAVCVAIPFLNLCITILGVALSWDLQRGMEYSIGGEKSSLLIAVVALLFLITIFRNLVAYVKQLMMINLNNGVNKRFAGSILKNIFLSNSFTGRQTDKINIKMHLSDVQKIQLAISNFAAITLSEGTLIFFIVSFLYYFQPYIALLLTVYIIIVSFIAFRNAPEVSYQTASLNNLSTTSESALIKDLDNNNNERENKDRINTHFRHHQKYLAQARKIAIKISRLTLFYESLGSLAVLSVFALSVYQLKTMQIAYGTMIVFVIASYFVTSLMPRICAAWVVIFEGVDACRHLNHFLANKNQ